MVAAFDTCWQLFLHIIFLGEGEVGIMKKISFDFTNRMLAIETSSQAGTEGMPEHITKSSLFQFVPSEHLLHATCFTFDFENNSFSVNQDIPLLNRERGEILTIGSFVPVFSINILGLNDNFMKLCEIIGYEEFYLSI